MHQRIQGLWTSTTQVGKKQQQKHMLIPNHRKNIAFLICDKPINIHQFLVVWCYLRIQNHSKWKLNNQFSYIHLYIISYIYSRLIVQSKNSTHCAYTMAGFPGDLVPLQRLWNARLIALAENDRGLSENKSGNPESTDSLVDHDFIGFLHIWFYMMLLIFRSSSSPLPSCHLATCGGPHHAPDWNKLLTQNIK